MVKSGDLKDCEFINVESEFAAMSVAIGASAAGARTYTATASQGLLFMAEAVYNASGLGLPIVMTVANRAIGAPINIWNDHTDSMSHARLRLDPALRRDQPGGARPAHPGLQARRGAVDAGDGVHGRLHPDPRLRARRHADAGTGGRLPAALRAAPGARPREPVSIGAMVGPEAFMEVRYLAHHKQMQALELIPQLAQEFKAVFGRDSGGLIRTYRAEDAETIVVALGSVNGTIKDVVDELRDEGTRSAPRHHQLPPLPERRTAAALSHAKRLVVLEKSSRSASAASSRTTCAWRSPASLHAYTVVAGLGGRAITNASPAQPVRKGLRDELEPLTFLDLNQAVIDRSSSARRRSAAPAPSAEEHAARPRRRRARNY
jgi:pyruvate ferredoxin oxidoreductase alpha subunit